MSITVKVEHKPKYIYLKCDGIFKLRDSLDVFDQAFELASKDVPTAILIDGRKVGVAPSISERFKIIEGLGNRWLYNRKPIVMAVIGNEPPIDSKRFVDIVATNRGFSSFSGFTDFDEAVSWLESELKKKNER